MSSGFRIKTHDSVNIFQHVDPAERTRMHPAHANVQRS